MHTFCCFQKIITQCVFQRVFQMLRLQNTAMGTDTGEAMAELWNEGKVGKLILIIRVNMLIWHKWHIIISYHQVQILFWKLSSADGLSPVVQRWGNTGQPSNLSRPQVRSEYSIFSVFLLKIK